MSVTSLISSQLRRRKGSRIEERDSLPVQIEAPKGHDSKHLYFAELHRRPPDDVVNHALAPRAPLLRTYTAAVSGGLC